MNTQDTLLAYSEWLDSQGLIVSDQRDLVSGGQAPVVDVRTHDELAGDFIHEWGQIDNAFPLAAAPEAHLGLATTRSLITELHARSEVSLIAGEQWPMYRTVDS